MSSIMNSNQFITGYMPSKSECVEVFRSCDCVCFDVDSTVIQEEGLDQLAAFYGKKGPVTRITEEAMKGGLDFQNALRARLNLIQPDLQGVREFIKQTKPKLTKDINTLVDLLQDQNIDVYLISGGFRSIIEPIADRLNIPLENVFANRMKFYYDGVYGGFDESHPCSRSGGKGEVIRLLKKRHGYQKIVMVGDGATDMEACPPADAFIGFGGNVVRQGVKSGATWYVYDFGTLIEEFRREGTL